MLTPEQNERLTRIGPGTPCGELMRRYWHPIAASYQLREHGTRPVRALGESLVLYRTPSGRLGLVGDKCPHRLGGMVMGIPEEEGLRCAYHGWLYNASGQCIAQPAEDILCPDSGFKERIKIKAYPVQEMGGLIWAYLGPEPVPLIPRWEIFVKEGVFREIGMSLIPANWLQCMENADGYHVPELHGRFSRYVLKHLGLDGRRQNHSSGAGMERFARPNPEVRTEFGLDGRRIDPVTGEQGPGRPLVFPIMILHPDMHAQIRFPVDDTHTLWFYYYTFVPEVIRKESGIALTPQKDSRDVRATEIPRPKIVDDWANPDWEMLDNNSAQDYAMLTSIGPIADRTMEHLGPRDVPVVAYRQFLEEQIRLVEEGREPINVFRDPEKNQCIVVPVEPIVERGDKMSLRNDAGRIDRTQAVRKYLSVYQMMDAKERGEEALKGPVY